MPVFEVALTLNDQEVCIALFDGQLVNNQIRIEQTDFDVNVHSKQFSTGPGGRFLKFTSATGGTIVRLQWDTPQNALAYQPNANGGSSTISIDGGTSFPILGSQCPGDPSLLNVKDALRFEKPKR
jgi:hypothetical protein